MRVAEWELREAESRARRLADYLSDTAYDCISARLLEDVEKLCAVIRQAGIPCE